MFVHVLASKIVGVPFQDNTPQTFPVDVPNLHYHIEMYFIGTIAGLILTVTDYTT